MPVLVAVVDLIECTLAFQSHRQCTGAGWRQGLARRGIASDVPRERVLKSGLFSRLQARRGGALRAFRKGLRTEVRWPAVQALVKSTASAPAP
jgi:hypothetical protein